MQCEIKLRIGKSSVQRYEDSLQKQTGLKLQVETIKFLYLEHSFLWCLKLRKVDQKYLETLECGVGEEWRRSAGPIG